MVSAHNLLVFLDELNVNGLQDDEKNIFQQISAARHFENTYR